MQVNFHVSPELKTEHAELFVQQLTPALQQVANQLLKEARLIWGYQADQMIPLDLQQVALISVVDQQVYAYLQDGRQLRLKQRLYQITWRYLMSNIDEFFSKRIALLIFINRVLICRISDFLNLMSRCFDNGAKHY